MKKLIILFIISSFVFMQDDIYNLFEIPAFKSKVFSISGDDLLNFKAQGDQSAFGFNVGGNYSVMNQSPLYTLNYGVNPSINSIKQPEDGEIVTDILVSTPFSGSKYLTDNYIGRHVFYDGTFDLSVKESTTTPLDLIIGIGQGRITSARTVAQAIIISDVLEANLSNNQLIEVSNIIAKASSGYYVNQYKNDADIHYYRDLATAANTDDVMKLQQILSNPAYANIAERFTGWQARVGYKNTLLDDSGSGELVFSGAYAKPIERDIQFYGGIDFNLGLESGAGSTAELFASYSIDHLYTWTSKVESVIDVVMPDGSDMYSIFNFKLSSTRIILNSLSTTGELLLKKAGGNNDAYIEMNVRFTYFIF